MKQSDAEKLIEAIKSLVEVEPLELPPPPPPSQYEHYKGVLINGEPPTAPNSFLGSKVFIGIATAIASVIAINVYYFIFL